MSGVRATLSATWALLGGVLFLMTGNGLQSTLLGVRSTLEGFDALAIGIIMASFKLFVVASAVVSVSLVPMALSAQSSPPIPETEPMTLREMRATVQTGLIAIFLAGLAGGTIGGLAAVHATQVGMSTSQISVFMSAILVGAVAFQLPLGAASGRLPRRLVMLATAIVGVGLALAGLVAPDTGWWPTLIILGIGGVSFPLYSLSVAYSNDWIPDGKRAGAATLLIMTNGVGATVGPLVGAMAMRWSTSARC